MNKVIQLLFLQWDNMNLINDRKIETSIIRMAVNLEKVF